jgi:hypothetical protein
MRLSVSPEGTFPSIAPYETLVDGAAAVGDRRPFADDDDDDEDKAMVSRQKWCQNLWQNVNETKQNRNEKKLKGHLRNTSLSCLSPP